MVFYFGKNKLRILLEQSLSRRELEIISILGEISGLTFSSAVRILRKKIPESTAKAVLRGLVKKGLIEKVNGHPILITKLGKKIGEVMKNG